MSTSKSIPEPFYDKDGITIYCGECSQIMSQVLANESIDLTVTSPPYDNLREYNGYRFEFEPIAKELWRVTGPGGVVVWVVADETKNGSESGTSFRQALGFMELGFRLHDTMIYQKYGYAFNDVNRYEQLFEYMFVLSKDSPKIFNPIKIKTTGHSGRTRGAKARGEVKPFLSRRNGIKPNKLKKMGNVWPIMAHGGNPTKDKIAYNHPAIFPEALARDHIISWSNPGDLVLDPMLGSGTVAKMAQALGRRCVGIEVSEEYCKIAVERLRQPLLFQMPEMPKDKVNQLSLV